MSRIKTKAPDAFAAVVGVALAFGLLLGAQVVSAAPGDPDFTFSPQSPLPGETVTFTATGLRGNDSVAWDFNNDGQFDATGTTVQHVYTTGGQRTVLMRVTRSDGAVDVLKTVTVNTAPTASFTASPNPATVGQTVQLNGTDSSDPDGTIASYAWDLDNDGEFDDATGATASRSFTSAGTYTVRLRVTDNRGSTGTATGTITVNSAPPPPNQAPVASFTAAPNPATVGQTVQLNGTASSDPDGTIASYAWDLDNDGQFDDATGATASRSFASAGTFTVRLRVTDDKGATGTATTVITVNSAPPPPNQAPVASFTAAPNPATVGQTVQLDAAASSDPDGTIASYAWDLDNDGQFDDASGATASRSFASAGTFTVRLRVTDDKGAAGTATSTIIVNSAPPPLNQAPIASFTATPNPATVGQTVQLNAAASSDPDGTIASYAWDLDNDGQFDDATGVTASRSFATAGTYTVRLRVTDDKGATGTATVAVAVNAVPVPVPSPVNRPPVASFTASPSAPLEFDTVQLVSTSSDPDGTIVSYAWDLDNDGQFDDSSSRAPIVRFGARGPYVVSLRVTDSKGASAIASRRFVAGPRAGASALDLMRPFPVVRIAGRSMGSNVRIRLLLIRSVPRGARVTVRCRGGGCPLRRRSRIVRKGSVRFRSFERTVPAGVRIQVFVTQPGKIGKYTSFKIRGTRPPVRKDLCVTSVRAKPRPCPAS